MSHPSHTLTALLVCFSLAACLTPPPSETTAPDEALTDAAPTAVGLGGPTQRSCSSDAECEVPRVLVACADAVCEAGACVVVSKDVDQDGVRSSAACVDPNNPTVRARTGTDCDDLNAARHPGLYDGPPTETLLNACNDLDEDCSGIADDGIAPGGAVCTCVPGRPCAPASTPGLTADVGTCRMGTTACLDSGEPVCLDAQGALPNECVVGRDDDCDGVRDELQANRCLDALGCVGVRCGEGACVFAPHQRAQRDHDGDGYCTELSLELCAGEAIPLHYREVSECEHDTTGALVPDCDDDDSSGTVVRETLIDRDGDGRCLDRPLDGASPMPTSNGLPLSAQECVPSPQRRFIDECGNDFKTLTRGVDCDDNNPAKLELRFVRVDFDRDGHCAPNFAGFGPSCVDPRVRLVEGDERIGWDAGPFACDDLDHCDSDASTLEADIIGFFDEDEDRYCSSRPVLGCSNYPHYGQVKPTDKWRRLIASSSSDVLCYRQTPPGPCEGVGCISVDCNDYNASVLGDIPYRQDRDRDRRCVGEAVGGCGNDTTGSIPAAQCLPGLDDCADDDPEIFMVATWGLDADMDRSCTTQQTSCRRPSPAHRPGSQCNNFGDCDDSDPFVSNNSLFEYQIDLDGDGYCTGPIRVAGCPLPAGAKHPDLCKKDQTDCNDNDASVPSYYWIDADGDGYCREEFHCGAPTTQWVRGRCTRPEGNCSDEEPLLYPRSACHLSPQNICATVCRTECSFNQYTRPCN